MRVGIVADLHEPFTHPMYMRFVMDTFNQWGVTKIHFIGDIVDNHALSFYQHDPNGLSAEGEAVLAEEHVAEWYKNFPKATVSVGNHDERHYRVARRYGIPDRYVRGYKDIWNTPGWNWSVSTIYDDVLYEHGTGSSGKDAALNRAMEKRTSLVMGHTHAFPGVKYHANDFDRIFALQVGCGIDHNAYAFAYSKAFATRGVLGCGIVIDGVFAYFEPMPCGPSEKYHRSRA